MKTTSAWAYGRFSLRTRSALQLSKPQHAFTRLECLVVAGSVFLLLVLALPALASKARTQQIICFNNLRQIGRAFHLWANDHNDLFPASVRVADGGAWIPSPGVTSPWLQFGVMSNELATPKILACPSDVRRVATEFSSNPTKGLFHSNFRDLSISYTIGHPFWREMSSVLSGDRNLKFYALNQPCSFFSTVAASIRLNFPADVQWTNSIHQNMGHLLYVDGKVSLVDNAGLPAALQPIVDDNGVMHFLVP